MRRLATEAMRDGAIGFSTSRTLNHRTASGDPTPSLRAGTDELEAIALGVADAGHGVVELISDFWPDTDGEFELVRTMVARTGVPALPLAGPEPPPSRGVARPPGAGSRPRSPTGCPSGPRWRRAPSGVLRRAAVLVPPAARRSRPTREIGGSCPWPSRRARCATRRSGPGSSPTWRRRTTPGRRRPRAGAAPSTTGACTRWATCPTTSRHPRRACCGWPRPGASIRPSCCWTCWRRTTAATSSTPRSPTTPRETSTPAARCSPTPTPSSASATGAPTWASSPMPASRPTPSRTGPATARHGRMEVGQVVEQLTSATARRRGPARPRRPGSRHAGGHQRHRLRPACAARRRSWPTTCPPGASGSCRAPAATAPPWSAGQITYRDGEPTGALPGRLVRGGRDATPSRPGREERA